MIEEIECKETMFECDMMEDYSKVNEEMIICPTKLKSKLLISAWMASLKYCKAIVKNIALNVMRATMSIVNIALIVMRTTVNMIGRIVEGSLQEGR